MASHGQGKNRRNGFARRRPFRRRASGYIGPPTQTMRESVDAQVPVGIAGDKRAMALRVAVAVFAALRAVLVYGEAARLTAEPLRLPRIRRAANSAPALIDARRSGALGARSDPAGVAH